jgi:hypothetical protein
MLLEVGREFSCRVSWYTVELPVCFCLRDWIVAVGGTEMEERNDNNWVYSGVEEKLGTSLNEEDEEEDEEDEDEEVVLVTCVEEVVIEVLVWGEGMVGACAACEEVMMGVCTCAVYEEVMMGACPVCACEEAIVAACEARVVEVCKLADPVLVVVLMAGVRNPVVPVWMDPLLCWAVVCLLMVMFPLMILFCR